MENALIIFVRNPEKGKIKSRLAKAIGDGQSMAVYKFLLQNTREVAISSNCSHFVFYSSYIHVNDVFDDDTFTKFLQEGDDLGERMMNAFKKVFDLGCRKVCIIGSDCYQLQTEIIDAAFKKLHLNEVVIGPLKDGGYYLLGMQKLYSEIFAAKDWGTSTVLDDTFKTIETMNLQYAELPLLNDIDTVEDLLETDILTKMKEELL